MKKILAGSLLLIGTSLYAQELKNVLSITVPVLTVRGGDDRTEFYINDRAYGEFDRSITDLISLWGRVRLSAFPIGSNRTGTLFNAGVGMRFWFSGGFKDLFLGPHGTVEVLDTYRTTTSIIVGGEVGYRIFLGENFALSLSGGPEVKFGDGPSMIGLSGYLSLGFGF